MLSFRYSPFERFPLKLIALVDPRVPDTEKAAIGLEFDRTPVCCLSPGMCQLLKEKRVSMRLRRNHEWIPAWALSITLSISDVERLHATNRAYNCGFGLQFHKIASFSLNRAARFLFAACRRSSAPAAPPAAPPLGAPELATLSRLLIWTQTGIQN